MNGGKNIKKQVYVIGNAAIYDHIYPISEEAVAGKYAEILDCPSVSGKVYYGGSAFNISVALARLGWASTPIHRVSEDFIGSEYERWLKYIGVNLSGIVVDSSRKDGHCFMFYSSDGSTLCFSFSGGVGASEQQDIPAGINLQPHDIFVVAPVIGTGTVELARMARSRGCTTIVCGAIPGSALDILINTDILICNEDEATYLLKYINRCNISELFEFPLSAIFITRGASGSEVFTSGSGIYECAVPAVPPRRFTDPTGAGDAYAAGVIAGLLYQLDMEMCARIGSAVASFVVEDFGAQTSLPTWGDMLDRLSQYYGTDERSILEIEAEKGDDSHE
ncbi:PfkB family carbohydrate kinase [Moorellaceae bacterium AZ2]